MSLITAQEITKVYGTRKNPIKALGPVSINIEPESFTVVLGRSGSGKSTLLNLFSGLDNITQGKLEVEGLDLSKANSRDLANYRSKIGIIFQSYNLLPNLTAKENVLMGSWAGGNKATTTEAEKLLQSVGLSHRLNANIKTLSGGEKQRVAICRSLVNKPSILFCDEPTGALDTKNENQIKEYLLDLNRNEKITIFMVTHNPEFQEIANNIILMKDGLIEKVEKK